MKTGGKRKKSVLLNIVIIFFSAAFLFSGYKVISSLINYQKNSSAYKDIEKMSVTENSASENDNISADSGVEGVVTSDAGITVDFDVLKGQNSDVVAWIYSAGTEISYPVVFGRDNSYYLTHRFDGTYSSFGTIFTDYRNSTDFTDMDTIIYGHNMDNGSMFASIVKYKKQEYFDKHPVIMLYTENVNYKLEIFAGYTASTDDICYNMVYTDDEFDSFISYAKEKSTFNSEIQVSPGDRIVTLSTCTYDFDDARYVILAKLTEA